MPRRGISVKSFAHNMVSGFCWLPDFCYRSLKNNHQFYCVCVCAVLFLILYDSTGVLHDFTVLYHLFFVWSGLVWCMGQVPDWEGLFEVLDSDGSGTLAWDELREGRWPSFSVLWIERPNSFLRFPLFAKLNLEFLLWKTLTNCNRVCFTSLNPFHFGVLGFLSINFLYWFSLIPLSMLAVELLATLHMLCPCRRRRFDFIAVCHYCIFCTFLYSMIVMRCRYWLLLWSSLCDRFPVACLLRSHVLLNLYNFKCLNTCQDLSLFGLAIRWTMYESDQGQPKPSKTTNQTETVRFLRRQQIHRDPKPNPVFAIEKGDRRWKTDHGRPGRLYTSMHHRYVQMRILRGYELLKMKDWDVLNMFEYAWSLHSTCAPMQMTWWCLTYFDITDHNDIDIDYDLTKQGLAQFLSWRRRVFYSIGHLFQCHCMIFAINSLPIFGRSCTFLVFFLNMAGFSEIASPLQSQ